MAAGSASPAVNGSGTEVHIRGRDLRQGLTKAIVLGAPDIAELVTTRWREYFPYGRVAMGDAERGHLD